MIKSFLVRSQSAVGLAQVVKAGIGGAIAIAVVAMLSDLSHSLWLMAPFGATCVLLFSAPTSPLSQPANVIAGHVLSTAIGVVAVALFPVTWWSMALAVGVAIAAMSALRVTHPPAGADPLVVMSLGAGAHFILFPALTGSVLLVLIAVVIHRIAPAIAYPNKPG
jgi:CBS-domain-containing membrane protein